VPSPSNEKLGAALFDGFDGCAVIETVGAAVSITHVRVAGDASTFPAASIARTANVCDPSVNELYTAGLVQAPKLPASSLHSKLATPLPPGSDPVNENPAFGLLVGSGGPTLMFVSGAVTSIDHVYESGGASTLSSASIALTWNVCEPSDRPE